MSALDPIQLRRLADSDLSTIESRARRACAAAYGDLRIFAITGDKIVGMFEDSAVEIDYEVRGDQVALGDRRVMESLFISQRSLEVRRREACALAAERCMVGDAVGAAAALSPFIGGSK